MTLYALLLFVLCGLGDTQNLPAQDNNFPHVTSLDMAGNFVVRWNFKSSHIAFEIIANTLGYVGFGISRTGRMFPADVFVAYVKQGEVHYGDFYTTQPYQLRLDSQQDWDLQYGYEENGKTIIGVIRKLELCDQDQDEVIKKGNLHLIYAYHPKDPENILALNRHTERGSKLVTLLVPPPEPSPPSLPQDTWFVDFNNTNFPIPRDESTTHCVVFNMSEIAIMKYHIVKIEPLFSSQTREHVHHLNLYRCRVPDNKANFVTGQRYNCFSDAPKELNFCQDFVAGFGHGDEAFYFPEDVGLGIGGDGEPNVYILAIQYENEKLLPDLIDNSGIRISYTPTLRPNEGAFLSMGNIISDKWQQFIPPRETNFLSRAYCSHRCINWGYQGVQKQSPMTAVGVIFHAHELGKKMKLRHITQTSQNTSENPWLAHLEIYDSEKQKINLFQERRKITKRDSLVLECSYDTTTRTNYTLGGWKENNELCRAYVLYYPRKALEGCMSWSNYDQLKDELGQPVNPLNAFDKLKTTDWSNNSAMRENLKTALDTSLEMEQCWSSHQDPGYAYSYFKQPTISSPYRPPSESSCPRKTV